MRRSESENLWKKSSTCAAHIPHGLQGTTTGSVLLRLQNELVALTAGRLDLELVVVLDIVLTHADSKRLTPPRGTAVR